MKTASTRDNTLDIVKGLGIILVVIGHAGCPQVLCDIISSFHMPLFFIASGFFFRDLYLDEKKVFLMKKIKGIYLPYLKWSLTFLVLHNLFFYFGIINSQYGSPTGVAHLYTLKEVVAKAFKIVFTMSSHEGFLLGAFWFMRALFLGSVLLCICSWLVYAIFKKRLGKKIAIVVIATLFFILGGVCSYYKVHPSFFPAGFYREFMAVFFIGCGYLIKNGKEYLDRWPFALVSLIVFIVCVCIHPTALGADSSFYDWLIIPISGISGFSVIYFLSKRITSHKFSNALIYIGQNSFYVLTFHFLMFKPAALLYSFVYDLDWHVIGCHPVAYQVKDNWFWIIYVISSLLLSLAFMQILRRIKLAK